MFAFGALTARRLQDAGRGLGLLVAVPVLGSLLAMGLMALAPVAGRQAAASPPRGEHAAAAGA